MVSRQIQLLSLAPSATLLLSAGAIAIWWQSQVTPRLDVAIDRGNWSACLHVSQSLQALRWPNQKELETQALCRRRQAQVLWANGQQQAALRLQRQLVRSSNTHVEDADQLQAWRQTLRGRALVHYGSGAIKDALKLLAILEEADPNPALSVALKQHWHQNRLEAERARELAQNQRWWEALDRLNRLDHPWWQQQMQGERETINAAIAALGASQGHLQHGSRHEDVIEGEALDQAVLDKLQQGLEAWSAFEAGCQSLGGNVVEDGPESFCRAAPAMEP